MLNRLRFAHANITGRVFFVLLIMMMFTHFFILLMHSHFNSDESKKMNKDLIVQQVLHIVQVMLTTPEKNRAKIIKSIDVPNITVSLTQKPMQDLAFSEASLWDILDAISEEEERIHLSVRLQENAWLNIEAFVVIEPWILQLFLLSLEVVLALAVLFYYWSINRFNGPVKQFAQAAERLGRDLHSSPLVEMGPPVVREAIHAMNIMQNRICDMVRERTLMLAAISHDLRTPITRLKLRTQFIDDDELRENTLRDLDEMNIMISEILSLSKEENDSQVPKSKVDLDALIASLCEDLLSVYPAITYYGPQSRALIFGYSLSLKRAFTNLIVNAIKYGNKAFVTLDNSAADEIIVIIEDEGDGIPEKEMQLVFTPFYRGEKSRSRATGGMGLGLAVAKDSIRAHLGTITVENRNEGGLRVKVTLPRFSKKGA